MKLINYFPLVCFVLMTGALHTQVRYGTIDYVRTTERELEVEGFEANKELQEMMAKMAAAGAFTESYQATFGPEGFSFVQQVKERTSMETEVGGGRMISIATGGEDPSHHHTNTRTGAVTNKDHIFDRVFLVQGIEEPLEWTETGEIVSPGDGTLGLELRLATAVSPAGDTVTAGFAPALPVQVGPLNYYGLPGAIITLRIPDGREAILYRATAMAVSNEPLPLVEPTEGKRISPAKFRQERAKRQRTTTRRLTWKGGK